MTQKTTKKSNYNALLAIEEVAKNPTLVEFIKHEIDLLEKRNTKRSDKPSKKQIENGGVKDSIIEAMEKGKLYQVKDMIKQFDFLEDMSNQRVAALVRQLVEESKLSRVEDKRVAYFTLAE